MTAGTAALIWFLVSAIPIALGGLGVLEGCLYLRGSTPITIYARNWSNKHAIGSIALGVGLVAGSAVAVTHFLVDR